ncbi:hypothetical protein V2G26_007312 [Clonostachys chloroleuca]
MVLSNLRATLPPGPSDPKDNDASGTPDLQSFNNWELEPQNPVAYPHIDAIDSSVLEQGIFSDLNQPVRSFSRLILSKPPSLQVLSTCTFDHGAGADALDWHPERDELPYANEESRIMPSPTLCDPRLQNLTIEFWTSVSISNDLAARVISLYLETDHPLLGHFDPDLFVHDLISHNSDYCSSLLVNALLYWGCQMYGGIDRRSYKLAIHFCREAEKQWLIGDQRDTLMRMAAAQFMSMAYLGQGRGHALLKYRSEAADIGKRLELFGVERSSRTAEIEKMSAADASAHSHAAWGVFNWMPLSSLFYRQPGMEMIRYPPHLPIPGGVDGGTECVLHSDLPEPTYIGHTFPHVCEFWRIMHEVCLLYYRDSTPRSANLILSLFTEFKFRELLAWSNSLPP